METEISAAQWAHEAWKELLRFLKQYNTVGDFDLWWFFSQ